MSSVHPIGVDLGKITGESAYDTWLGLGNRGTEEEFIASLKGEQGLRGERGEQGLKGDIPTPKEIVSAVNSSSEVAHLISEGSNKIATAGAVFDFLSTQKAESKTIYLSQAEIISLEANTTYSIQQDNKNCTPTLFFPATNSSSGATKPLPDFCSIVITIRSLDGNGVGFAFSADCKKYCFIEKESETISQGNALLMRADWDGSAWFIHYHEFATPEQRIATIILDGSNQYGEISEQIERLEFPVSSNDSFVQVPVVNLESEKWKYLFGNKCKLLGWTDKKDDASLTPKYTSETPLIVMANQGITLYPIYEIEEQDINVNLTNQDWRDMGGLRINGDVKILLSKDEWQISPDKNFFNPTINLAEILNDEGTKIPSTTRIKIGVDTPKKWTYTSGWGELEMTRQSAGGSTISVVGFWFGEVDFSVGVGTTTDNIAPFYAGHMYQFSKDGIHNLEIFEENLTIDLETCVIDAITTPSFKLGIYSKGQAMPDSTEPQDYGLVAISAVAKKIKYGYNRYNWQEQ